MCQQNAHTENTQTETQKEFQAKSKDPPIDSSGSQWGSVMALSACDCNPHIQESAHPRAPKSPKSLKKVFPGLPARSVKKVSKKPPSTDFVVFLTLFRVICLVLYFI